MTDGRFWLISIYFIRVWMILDVFSEFEGLRLSGLHRFRIENNSTVLQQRCREYKPMALWSIERLLQRRLLVEVFDE